MLHDLNKWACKTRFREEGSVVFKRSKGISDGCGMQVRSDTMNCIGSREQNIGACVCFFLLALH